MRINEPINDLRSLRCSGEWLRVYYLLLAMQRICYPLQNECQGFTTRNNLGDYKSPTHIASDCKSEASS